MNKKCSKCKITKDINNFNLCKKNKDGYKYRCKQCSKEYRENNKKQIKESKKQYYENNKEQIINKQKHYRQDNLKYVREKDKQKYKNNKEQISKRRKEYRQNNLEYVREKDRKKYQKVKHIKKEQAKNRRIINKNIINLKERIYYHENKIIKCIRRRLLDYVTKQGFRKTNTTINTIGINKKSFKKWILWNMKLDKLSLNDNIHLDHFYPLNSFILNNFNDVITTKCNHWTNIRPLLAYDNISKGNKIPTKKEQFKMELRIIIFKIQNNIN